MHTHKLMWLAAILVALSLTAVVYAQTGSDYDLSWNTIDSGGTIGSSGGDTSTSLSAGFGLSGSIGQADAGTLSGGDFQLSGGFWYIASTDYRILLPLIMKS
jgi:hypothetical protein